MVRVAWEIGGVKWVLFFDGDCAFCAKSVRHVFDLDKRGAIDFSPLQGELAHQHGLEKHANPEEGSMVLLRETDGAVFLRSDALLELARALGGWCRIGLIGSVVPRCIRDRMYRWLARNRHRFSKVVACRMPTPELLQRMRP